MTYRSLFRTVASRTSAPLLAAYLVDSTSYKKSSAAACEKPHADDIETTPKEDDTDFYHGMFPRRQLWKPKYEYPLWDRNWDQREPVEQDKQHARLLRKSGVTRHVILIRHGQYDETYKEDEKRKLTDLGKLQAEYTGRRLAEMLQGADGDFSGCHFTKLHVSNMTRAKETAEIIAKHLPPAVVARMSPDPLLNEGRPCHHVPGTRATPKMIELTDDNHKRIESAFQKYFYRADPPAHLDGEERHEFEIFVCHANVIRYFMCRALQLPPEVWLRYCPFNCSLTYITIRPTGSVSCRMLGDTGHLQYNATTFSKHHGFNW